MSPARWDVHTAPSFDFLSAEYRDLFANSAATVFQSPLWMDRLYQRLAADQKVDPLIIIIRERESGKLAAVLPFIVRQRRQLLIAEFADFGVCDYCAPICDSRLLQDICKDGTLARQVRGLLRPCDLLIIQKVRSDALPLFGILGRTRQSRLPFTAHAATLFAPYEAWREASISETQRRFLDTKRKRLAKRGPLITSPVTSKEGIQQAIEDIRRFREYRFNETGIFNLLKTESFAQFYREVSNDPPPARAYIMTVSGTPVSAAFTLDRNGTLHFILSGFDFLNYRNASIGLLIIEDIIEDCIARGITTLDFTIGNQAYKKEFGTHEMQMWTVWLGISRIGRAAAFFLSRSSRLRQLARRLMRR